MRLSSEEKEIIYEIAEELTGTCQQGRYRKDILANNVIRRMHVTGHHELWHYIEFAMESLNEFSHLISALTIHTTSWFREIHHYEQLKEYALKNIEKFKKRPFVMLCAACSTGEEVYSFALVLEELRLLNPGFEYRIDAFDLDPVSIGSAREATYDMEAGLKSIPLIYRNYMEFSTIEDKLFFQPDSNIRKRCFFSTGNLTEMTINPKAYSHVVCRNALIYFDGNAIKKVVSDLLRQLDDEGVLVLGSSDFINVKEHSIKSIGNTRFVCEKSSKKAPLISGQDEKTKELKYA